MKVFVKISYCSIDFLFKRFDDRKYHTVQLIRNHRAVNTELRYPDREYQLFLVALFTYEAGGIANLKEL